MPNVTKLLQSDQVEDLQFHPSDRDARIYSGLISSVLMHLSSQEKRSLVVDPAEK